jgi:hypothetical protein
MSLHATTARLTAFLIPIRTCRGGRRNNPRHFRSKVDELGECGGEVMPEPVEAGHRGLIGMQPDVHGAPVGADRDAECLPGGERHHRVDLGQLDSVQGQRQVGQWHASDHGVQQRPTAGCRRCRRGPGAAG